MPDAERPLIQCHIPRCQVEIYERLDVIRYGFSAFTVAVASRNCLRRFGPIPPFAPTFAHACQGARELRLSRLSGEGGLTVSESRTLLFS